MLDNSVRELSSFWIKSLITCGCTTIKPGIDKATHLKQLFLEKSKLEEYEGKIQQIFRNLSDELNRLNSDILNSSSDPAVQRQRRAKFKELDTRISTLNITLKDNVSVTEVDRVAMGILWVIAQVLGNILTLSLAGVIYHYRLNGRVAIQTAENTALRSKIESQGQSALEDMKNQLKAVALVMQSQKVTTLRQACLNDTPQTIEDKISQKQLEKEALDTQLGTLRKNGAEELKSDNLKKAELEQKLKYGGQALGILPPKYQSLKTKEELKVEEETRDAVTPIFNPIFKKIDKLSNIFDIAFDKTFDDLIVESEKVEKKVNFNKSSRIIRSKYIENVRAAYRWMVYNTLLPSSKLEFVCRGEIVVKLNSGFEWQSPEPHRVITVDKDGRAVAKIMFAHLTPLNPEIGDPDLPEGQGVPKDLLLAFRELKPELRIHVENLLLESLIDDRNGSLCQTKVFMNQQGPDVAHVKLLCDMIRTMAKAFEKKFHKNATQILRTKADSATCMPFSKNPSEWVEWKPPLLDLLQTNLQVKERFQQAVDNQKELAKLYVSPRLMNPAETDTEIDRSPDRSYIKEIYSTVKPQSFNNRDVFDSLFHVLLSTLLLRQAAPNEVNIFKRKLADVIEQQQNRLNNLAVKRDRTEEENVELKKLYTSPINDLEMALGWDCSPDTYLRWLRDEAYSRSNPLNKMNLRNPRYTSDYLNLYKVELTIITTYLLKMKIRYFEPDDYRGKVDEEGLFIPENAVGPDTLECLILKLTQEPTGFIPKINHLAGDTSDVVGLCNTTKQDILLQ